MSNLFETRHAPSERMAAHRHPQAYASLVLEGSYVEASSDGRFKCIAGVLTIHPQWHQHSNEFGAGGATVLNFPAPFADAYCAFRVPDTGSLAQLAHRYPLEAAHAALEEASQIKPVSPADWLVRFVGLLAANRGEDISELAAQCGVSTEHAIRSCKRWFGLTPAALRREKRLHFAIELLKSSATPAEAAFESGFSDQPHLTRLLKRATGLTPGVLSAS